MKKYIYFAILCIILIFGAGSYLNQDPKDSVPIPTPTPESLGIGASEATKPEHPTINNEFNEPIQDTPLTGLYNSFTTSEFVAPLKIQTDSTLGNYFIKLSNADTDEIVMTFFIRSGESLDTKIPLGIYNFRYAYGDLWYGDIYLFGPNTTRIKATDPLNFYYDGNQFCGMIIKLIKQVDGNMDSNFISESNW